MANKFKTVSIDTMIEKHIGKKGTKRVRFGRNQIMEWPLTKTRIRARIGQKV